MDKVEFWTAVAVASGAVKVAATLALAAWPGGSAAMTARRAGRWVYWAGKLSPLVLLAALVARAGSLDDLPLALGCAGFLVATGIAVIVVTRLRARGSWYGIVHALRERRSSRRR